jgi:hypothetical protein
MMNRPVSSNQAWTGGSFRLEEWTETSLEPDKPRTRIGRLGSRVTVTDLSRAV